MKNKMILTTVTLTLMMTVATISSLNSARAESGSESDFKGTNSVQLAYSGTNGAKVFQCAIGFWLGGAACMNGSNENWDFGADWEIAKNLSIGVDQDVVVKTWGEGKVLVIYSLEATKGCAGIQKTYVGYETAYQTFDLYERTAGRSDVDPTNSKPDAELTIEKKSAQLGLFQTLDATSPQNSNGDTCAWHIATDVALKFDLQD